MLKKIGDHSLIEWTINSTSKIQGTRDVIVLTSSHSSDDLLTELANFYPRVRIFRGPLTMYLSVLH